MSTPKIRFATVAEMETLKRPSVRDGLIYCDETGKAYSFEGDNSTARDGTIVLNTGWGGNTRFISRTEGAGAGTVAWGDVTGKPSTFAPSSHGNAAHSSTFVTQSEIDGSIDTHEAVTASVHNFDASGNAPAQEHGASAHSTAAKTEAITITIDNSGVAITTGAKSWVMVPYACSIVEWTLLADPAGAIVVDIWKDSYANALPTDADSICAAALPTISATNMKGQSSTLTDWTTAITAGDILRFNVDSCTDITHVTLTLRVTRT